MIMVDTNVLLDVLQDDPKWAAWSQGQLESAALTDRLAINAVIYSELSMAFERI
jgi:predicted nucleic acid-binding protein